MARGPSGRTPKYPIFHVVFTLPQQIATIAYQNKRELYGILFKATAETLLAIAADPKHLGQRSIFRCTPYLGI